jgi:uncharacterized protein YbbC (DUF1343 family)
LIRGQAFQESKIPACLWIQSNKINSLLPIKVFREIWKMKIIFILFILFQVFKGQGQPIHQAVIHEGITPGAERLEIYLPMLQGRTVAVFANATSMVGSSQIVDTLLKLGVHIKKIFSPEHGFRGRADAGESVGNLTDSLTGIPVISLYGKKLKPSPEDLKDVDILIFDIQDVGVRFYTYISSLQKFMEAAFENRKPLLLLDRPDPNGFYVDGPVLDTSFRSFVGMQSVPIVYGMTLGEYARLIAGEKWLSPQANERYSYYEHAENSADTPFHFLVIKCLNYTHDSLYQLPVKPSPNLPNMQSVYLYPSLCLFEGTAISLGRGTDKPFQQFGHPSFPNSSYHFTPRSLEGARTPPLLNQICNGFDLSSMDLPKEIHHQIQLKWLIQAYDLFVDKGSFFLSSGVFFNRLAGGNLLIQQIKNRQTEMEIRQSWEPALGDFKKIRKKYLLYSDFN